MLKHINDTAQTSNYLEFGTPAQVAKLNGGTDPESTGTTYSGTFWRLVGQGATEMRLVNEYLFPLTGIDANSAITAVSVGKPPNSVEILYGSFDTDAIGAKLAAWGYRKQDRGGGITAWVWSDNHQLDTSKLDPDTGLGPGGDDGWLNVVWVSKSRIAYGYATSDLAAALPEQPKPLSSDSVVGPLADCLGSALAGVVMTDGTEGRDPSIHIPAIAFGVTATSAADIREEICVAAPDDASAHKFEAEFTKEVDSGDDPQYKRKWSAELSDPKTDLIGGSRHMVRLSAIPVDPQKSGMVLDMVRSDNFETLLGLPEKNDKGQTVYPDGTVSPADPSSASS